MRAMGEFKDNKYITVRMDTYKELKRKEELFEKAMDGKLLKINVDGKNYYMDLDLVETHEKFYKTLLGWDFGQETSEVVRSTED